MTTLETERLILREFEEDDLQAIQAGVDVSVQVTGTFALFLVEMQSVPI